MGVYKIIGYSRNLDKLWGKECLLSLFYQPPWRSWEFLINFNPINNGWGKGTPHFQKMPLLNSANALLIKYDNYNKTANYDHLKDSTPTKVLTFNN